MADETLYTSICCMSSLQRYTPWFVQSSCYHFVFRLDRLDDRCHWWKWMFIQGWWSIMLICWNSQIYIYKINVWLYLNTSISIFFQFPHWYFFSNFRLHQGLPGARARWRPHRVKWGNLICAIGLINSHHLNYTLEDERLEPTNHPIRKGNHLPNLHEDMFHVNWRCLLETTIFRCHVTPVKINMEHVFMEVWKMIFLSKWVIYRFHVNLPGCNRMYPPWN